MFNPFFSLSIYIADVSYICTKISGMDSFYFYLILLIIIADYIFERFLDYLNSTRWSDSLPVQLKGIYDEEKYRQQQAYEKENHRFGLMTSGFGFLLVIMMLVFEGFAWLNNSALDISTHPVVSALLFFGILFFASDLLTTPFSVYDTFRIEAKYGFNTTTPRTFVFDKLKGWLLGAVLGGGILSLIVWIYLKTGDYFWMVAWIAISVFSIFMTLFYSNLIVPLFNKQTPLEQGELRDAIEKFSLETGFMLKDIFVIDGSKRSTKANAYFTGLGRKKRIVLYDTLISEMNTNEIVAVLAHEVGHYKKKHVLWGLVLSLIQTGFMFFLFSFFTGNVNLSRSLGVEVPNFQIAMVAFGILYSPVSFVLGIFMHLISRKNEYTADQFAAKHFNPESLASALKKLSVKNLSNLTPHPWYVFFNYSHPTLLQRLEKLGQI